MKIFIRLSITIVLPILWVCLVHLLADWTPVPPEPGANFFIFFAHTLLGFAALFGTVAAIVWAWGGFGEWT